MDSLIGITANGQSVAVTATAGTITVSSSVTTAGGNITLSAINGITLSNALSSGGGNIVLQADADANGTGSLTLSAAVMGSWAQLDQLNAANGNAGDQFGRSVAFSSDGNTAIVGAYLDDVGASIFDQGTATVFTRVGDVWAAQQELNVLFGGFLDNFGFAVALSSDGNTAIVGGSSEGDSDGLHPRWRRLDRAAATHRHRRRCRRRFWHFRGVLQRRQHGHRGS